MALAGDRMRAKLALLLIVLCCISATVIQFVSLSTYESLFEPYKTILDHPVSESCTHELVPVYTERITSLCWMSDVSPSIRRITLILSGNDVRSAVFNLNDGAILADAIAWLGQPDHQVRGRWTTLLCWDKGVTAQAPPVHSPFTSLYTPLTSLVIHSTPRPCR